MWNPFMIHVAIVWAFFFSKPKMAKMRKYLDESANPSNVQLLWAFPKKHPQLDQYLSKEPGGEMTFISTLL